MSTTTLVPDPSTPVEVIPGPVVRGVPEQPVADDPNLVADWLASKSPCTRRAYAGDLDRFARWVGLSTAEAAASHILAAGPCGARHLVLTYRGHQESRGLSPATINRALAALRSVVELARDAGLVDWSLNAKGLRARAYRDTTGPCRADMAAVLAAADTHRDCVKAARDGALLRLLYGLAMRRSEAVGLDVLHVDLDAGRVFVKGKGKHDREPMTLPVPARQALARWLDSHPDPRPDAPLFPTLDRVSRGKRLSDRSVARVLKAYCRAAGVRVVAPHALRHAAITAALDATGGDVRKVWAFSRHAKLETVAIYDDKRTDGAAEVAALVAI